MEVLDTNKLEELYQSLLNDERILRMKNIPMHRGSNCYLHSFRVCKLAIKKAIKKDKGNLVNILVACILHDYYLYDWRTDKELRKNHAKHPFIASTNAKRDFGINDEVKRIIECHMYPINREYKPKTFEEKLVAKCDTRVAFLEFLTSKRYKKKRMDKYLQKISKLFD